MAITYRVDAGAGLAFEDWRGVITADDVHAHWTRMVNDPAVLACRGSLADIRECWVDFTGPDLQRLALTVLEPAFRGRQLRVAILVKDPVQYGVARQHRAFSSTFTEAVVFTDAAMAREWLLSPG